MSLEELAVRIVTKCQPPKNVSLINVHFAHMSYTYLNREVADVVESLGCSQQQSPYAFAIFSWRKILE